MIKKLAVVALASLLCLAFAQSVTPTVGNAANQGGGVDQFVTHVDSASVDQNVNLILPPAVALHLDVSELDFNLELLGTEDAPYVCVYGSSLTDTAGGSFNSQQQTLPLGTSYTVGSEWTAHQAPTINIQGGEGLVASYPPAAFDSAGELVPRSKNHFICYQTFVLQKFSNHSQWQLGVSRSGEGAFDMYIQDNTICSFNANQATGFFKIENGGEINLLPAIMTNQTTGALAEECNQDGKSWLDDLVVVAVKVNGDPHGTNTAVLTYTISSVTPQ